MNENGIKPLAVAAGRPICARCEMAIALAGARAASALKGAL